MMNRRDMWLLLAKALVGVALVLLDTQAPAPARLYDPPYVRPRQHVGMCAFYLVPAPPAPALPPCPPGRAVAPAVPVERGRR